MVVGVVVTFKTRIWVIELQEWMRFLEAGSRKTGVGSESDNL